MRIRWERAGHDGESVTYYVDDEPAGADDAGFDRVLEIVAAWHEPVTIGIHELSLGGGSPEDGLPFSTRLDELRAHLGGRRLELELF